MDAEIATLEQKLATLIAHTRALRAANESLRRDLAAVQEQEPRARDANARGERAPRRAAGAHSRRRRMTTRDAAERTVTLDVNILGRDYKIACRRTSVPSSRRRSRYLDGRMREIRDQGKMSGADRIAVMAALNIAHDLLRERGGATARGARRRG